MKGGSEVDMKPREGEVEGRSHQQKPKFRPAEDDTKPILQDPILDSGPIETEEAVLRLPPFLKSNPSIITQLANGTPLMMSLIKFLKTIMYFRVHHDKLISGEVQPPLAKSPMVIDEFDGLVGNEVYEAAGIYLSNMVSPFTCKLRVSKPEKEKSFQLCFHKKHGEKVFNSYLPHILKISNWMKGEKKTLKIFTMHYESLYGNLAKLWKPVKLNHPATFDTLAMDIEMKEKIMEDLERFVKRKEFYRRVGKAWKRGLLVATANRSIFVVEDIDCLLLELQNRAAAMDSHRSHEKQVRSLSGLLNFIDGLWSSCGDKRIIVFTTNHKERLDPALLRPGCMDMHIHMSYCTPCGFKLLAFNYLNISDHPLFDQIEELMEKVKVTTAEVAKKLTNGDAIDIVLRDLVEFLHKKMIEINAAVDLLHKKMIEIDAPKAMKMARTRKFKIRQKDETERHKGDNSAEVAEELTDTGTE
ncbi:hypothetical protein GIB67_005568 [Kingdonia uniflora]|uniref:ATPase AAA-type core domain-containing protein n=1 Tax=Kingdonia uniflora TaxID=39325 RepID=A0A7J7NHP9_9MAGN|nr:hypothetical protein GIB67_005568 [Kingdonia uniflora]